MQVYEPPDSRRIIPVRVADVPLEERRKAAGVAARHEVDPYEAVRIRMVAEEPGDLIAWVAP